MSSNWHAALFSAIGAAAVLMVFSSVRYATGSFTFEQWMLIVVNWAVPLLSFAGFIAVYLGFKEQKAQNELLEKQLEHQENALLDQKKRFEKQNFEDTFFQLIRLHNDIVDSINHEVQEYHSYFSKAPPSSPSVVSGRDCFRHFYQDLEDAYNSRETELSVDFANIVEQNTEAEKEPDEQLPERDYLPERDIDGEKLGVRLAYGRFWSDNRADLEHYFQSLLQLLSHVIERKSENNEERSSKDTEMYIDIVVAQLSTYELLMLAYHYLCGYAPPKMKHYIAEYDVLRHMPSGALLSEEHILVLGAELSEQASEKT